MRNLRNLIVLSFLVSATGAFGQTAAPAPAPATAAPVPFTSSCVKPAPYPGKKAPDAKKEAWQKDIKAWGDCVRTYVTELQAQIAVQVKVANSTIEGYNAGIKELQDEQKKAEGIVD
jgi:hypothetical protein